MTEVPNTVKVLQDRDLLVKFPRLLIQLVGRTEYTKNAKKKYAVLGVFLTEIPHIRWVSGEM